MEKINRKKRLLLDKGFQIRNFLVFMVTWIANNLSIPFWVVGHVHLSVNIYQDFIEILSSMGMNIIVAIGFWLDYKNSLK